MKLLIDIGNTRIDIAIKDKSLKIWRSILTASKFNLPSYLCKNTSKVIVCSVVPHKSKELESFFRKKGIKSFFVGRDLKVPLKINYRQKDNLGQDRILCCYGARSFFPQGEISVLDFGTALTLDFLSCANVYEGGIIFPGVQLSLECLINKASLLKNTKLEPFRKPRRMIAKTTKDCILSGVFYGYKALCEGLVNKMRKKYPFLKVVLTGGGCSIAKDWDFIDLIEPHLSLYGLNKLTEYYKI